MKNSYNPAHDDMTGEEDLYDPDLSPENRAEQESEQAAQDIF